MVDNHLNWKHYGLGHNESQAKEIELLREQNETLIEALLGFLADMDIYGAPKRQTVREGHTAIEIVIGDSDD